MAEGAGSDLDSDDDVVRYSGMQQPPLIKQLKTILSEYPDDGQILKEIIQNAEDAEAKELKILYDGRPVNTEPSENKKTRHFRKYFKGPALLIYNDAKFTPKDWEGITMLYCSNKEFDRTKVGRFGLGFKSVFHVTDYPVVISGENFLVLDPHQKEVGRVCQMIELSKLHKCRRMDVSDCLNCFNGIFGFSQKILDCGYYNGTIFRFPLRAAPTELSDNVYDESKVVDLIKSFEMEAPVTLLFLKSLEKIKLFTRDSTQFCVPPDDQPVFTVSVEGKNANEVKEKRRRFLIEIKQNQPLPQATISCQFEITIKTSQFKGKGFRNSEATWLVYNMFKGGSMSSHLRQLSMDENLGYSPYVGTAYKLSSDTEFKGHVFCFLPLPLESRSLTGLPLHVNGFFALSQNRRHVKWPTADQVTNHSHKDKSIQWNECLISEVLSEAYLKVIKNLIQNARTSHNPENLVSMVTRCIPDVTAVDEKWQKLIQLLCSSLLQEAFLFTSNDGGHWIKYGDAVFAEFRKSNKSKLSYDAVGDNGLKTIMSLVKQYSQNIVEVPPHISRLIEKEVPSPQYITPSYVCSLLKTSRQYTTLSFEEKLHILLFILEDEDYRILEGLELLPLHTGSFTAFIRRNNTSCQVYQCSSDNVNMFPGVEQCFVSINMTQKLQSHFERITQQGLYQIQPFSVSDFVPLLTKSITAQFGTTSSPIRIPSSVQEWLQIVWRYLRSNFKSFSGQLQNIPILPVLQYPDNTYYLYNLSELFILRSFRGMKEIPHDVCKCLVNLSVIVLQSLPEFVTHHPEVMKRFVLYPGSDSVIDLLTKVSRRGSCSECISTFNERCSKREKESFLTYIQNLSPNNNANSVLKQMELFDGSNSSGKLCVNNVGLLAPLESIPVSYPKELLMCEHSRQRDFARMLGAVEMTLSNVVGEILNQVVWSNYSYSTDDVHSLMLFIQKKMQQDQSVMQKAREVSFVSSQDGNKYRPSELFDSSKDLLRKLFPDGRKFPVGDFSTPGGISFLQKLGLKSTDSLTASDIQDSANFLHEHADDQNTNRNMEQSKAIMDILKSKPQLLNQIILNSRQSLSSALYNIRFIKPKAQPGDFPKILNWYGDTFSLYRPSELIHGRFYRLVGSVSPLLPDSASQTLAPSLGIDKPSVDMVIEQLNLIVQSYESKHKPELLPLIKEIYTYLAQNVDYGSDDLENMECAWTGGGFCLPDMLYVTTTDSDVSLKPYLYHLPGEFQSIPNIKTFFRQLGSKDRQDLEVLKNVQQLIQKKHTSNVILDTTVIKQDLQIVIKILTRIKEILGSGERQDHSILFPIHTVNGQLVLKPVLECRYSNADWLKDISDEEGEEIFFVHPDVPRETAVMLGVLSLTQDLLSDAEGFEEWGQTEPLTRRIKNILKDYTDGFSVPKEIVQNADDAGATRVCFVYDERENEDARIRLLDEKMSSCQGPALWAYNNAKFTKDDLKNITKLSGATKEEDLKKIGKFGLGFCCVYNLTDVPSFITGDQIVIFDPHAKYLGKAVSARNPGLKINLGSVKNQIMVKRLKNQFKPFNGIFGCDLTMKNGSNPFDGTLFRFPLRTAAQASESEISSKPYPKQEMKSLLNLFMESAGNILLFTQNVSEIELYHIPSNAQSPEMKLIYSVKRNIVGDICRSDSGISMTHDHSINPDPMSRMSIVSDFSSSVEKVRKGKASSFEKVGICTQINIHIDVKEDVRDFKQKPQHIEANWIVSWASGTDATKSHLNKPEMKKALPLAATAALINRNNGKVDFKPLKQSPYGFYKESHFFCYLPLPVESPLPIHLNGSFAVTANRRQLSCKTIDDKESVESMWNEALMSDAVCNAYIQLLESLQDLNFESDKMYSELWPVLAKEHHAGNLLALQKSFYQKVVQENPVVFRRNNIWEPFSNCIFMLSSLMRSKVGSTILSTTIHFKEENCHLTIMELDEKVKKCFDLAGCTEILNKKIMTLESFYQNIFFPNISSDYWEDKEEKRNLIVHYALCHRTPLLDNLLKTTPCIPTEPNGRLKKPEELILPSSSLINLFSKDDERFISSHACKGIFKEENVLRELKSLGIMDLHLPNEIVLERVCSIEDIGKNCSKCAAERCKHLLNYLTKHVKNEDGKKLLKDIGDIKFLPVKMKPENWEFPWRGDFDTDNTETSLACSIHNNAKPCIFEKPSALYHAHAMKLVGCKQIILEETDISFSLEKRRLIADLGVKGEHDNSIQAQAVVEHLITICQLQTTEMSKSAKALLSDICSDIYKYFDSKLSRIEDALREDLNQQLNKLKTFPVILLNDQFLRPERVALFLELDCSPCLYGINNNSLHYKKNFLQAVGVKDRFEFEDVLDVVLTEQNKYTDQQLSQECLGLFCNLLQVLSNSMKIESISADVLRRRCNENMLLVPDDNMVLKPIEDLCMDDSKYIRKSKTMTFVNEKISLEVANRLGIKSKKRTQLKEHSRKLPFGQHEELTTRLKRILTGYPCDEGILKELLQNADDAGATEIHIIKDFQNHPADHVFENWKPLQGPSLLVYNNRAFTEADIEGIQKLGIGSKSDDPTKTGQFGVGFNAVYHLTDVPSFLTKGPEVVSGETLCIMDPNRRYVDGAEDDSPGLQYIELEDIKQTYPDVFRCYYEDQLLQESGTVFRLPLRNQSMAQSSGIKSDPISQDQVQNLMDKFKEEMKEMLLFVKNVKRIKLSNLSSGHLEEEYTVEVHMSEEDKNKRKDFLDHVKKVSTTLHQTRDLTTIESKEVSYMVSIEDTNGKSKSWLIVHRMGFKQNSEALDQSVLTAYRNEEIGMLPIGGVALPLLAHYRAPTFSAFCFLPLPCQTGLPVIVNGHFDLDHETRRSLWENNKKDNHVLWNENLIKHVVVPSYLTAVQVLKEKLCLVNGTQMEESKLDQALKKFHSVFPDVKKANGKYWKHLTASFYKQIVDEEEDVFVSYFKKAKDSKEWNVSFYSLISTRCHFISVFDGWSDHRGTPTSTEVEKSKILRRTSKMLGMKLLNSPLLILENLHEAGVSIASTITPEYMIKFLKSYGKEDVPDRCFLDGVGKKVTETSFLEKRNVLECLQYCKNSETFLEQVEGLPLCLTNDDVLQTFSRTNPVFCTKYCTLFKSSPRSFLCSEMVNYFDADLGTKNGIFKVFDMKAVALYLPEVLPSEKFQQYTPVAWQYIKEIGVDWIRQFWKLIYELTEEDLDKVKDTKEKRLKLIQSLHPLLRWSLLPCLETVKVLFPISQYEKLILRKTFSGAMEKTLRKLNLPDVDEESFYGYRKAYGMITTNLVAKQDKPLEVLNCLFLHQQKLNDLNETDCNSISQYLSENLEQILSCTDDEESIRSKLKDLPIHITIQGTRTSLGIQRNVLLLPNGLPPNGIESWGEQSSVILLKNNDILRPLYEFLQFSESNLCNVYTDHIFKTFHFLSQSDQLEHLEYIKGNLLSKMEDFFNQDEKRLVQGLKKLDFILTTEGSKATASNFYSPHIEVFEVMGDFLSFPPEPFCKQEWSKFMQLSGMKTTVTPQMFVSFIEEVEKRGLQSENVEKRCKTLVNHLFSSDAQNYDLQRISKIKFIIPHKVRKFLARVHAQFNTERLICFSGSLTSNHENLMWTNCDLIPSWATPPHHLQKNYGICDKPSFQKFVQHVQNVCDSLKENIEKKKEGMDRDKIHVLMNGLYEYLNRETLESDENKSVVKHGLELKPLIYLRENHKLMTCNNVVKELEANEIIISYLYPLPDEYVPYFKLFELLGTNRKVECDNFARVLEQMAIAIAGKEMHPNELRVVRNVIMKLFFSVERHERIRKEDSDAVDLKVKVLYLPSRECKLVDASKLIYSDFPTFEEYVKREENLVFFIGFEELGIHFPMGSEYIKLLPTKYKPKLLSELIVSTVDTTSLEVANDGKGRQLQDFIQRSEFVESLLRLIFHEASQNQLDQTIPTKPVTDPSKIVAKLQSITIYQVKSLEMAHTFKGKDIGRESIHCYSKKSVHEQNEEWLFYFCSNEEDWIQQIDFNFASMLNSCVGFLLSKSIAQVCKLLTNINHPEKLKKMLDKMKIMEYSLSQSPSTTIFPPAGDIVHPKWHFMLDNTFTEFEVGEYVALQIADEEIPDGKESDSEQVFMYAIVKKKLEMQEINPSVLISLDQMYILKIGSGRVKEVPAYKIYKFNRNMEVESRELAVAEHIPPNRQQAAPEPISRPLEDVYREVRQILKAIWGRSENEKKIIIKRLLRKWHPDKNYGNEEFAKNVFQYIKQCIKRLDNGEDIDEAESSNSGGRRSNPTYEAWFNDVDRSCRRDSGYQQRARQSRSSRGHGYGNSHSYPSQREETPLPQEAKRWYRQGCKDLLAAQTFCPGADDIGAYNWICYNCYQAAEKVMKAVWYYRDANRVTESHELRNIANGLEPEVRELANALDALLGSQSQMCYPDIHQMPNIPSDMFDANVSAKAIEITQKLCDVVSGILW